MNRYKPLMTTGILLFLGTGFVSSQAQDETITFEDDQQILTRLSENLSMDQISLKSFRCHEKLVVTQAEAKGQTQTKREWLNLYRVERQQNRQVATRVTFRETRVWQKSPEGEEPSSLADLPVLDSPFTGALNQIFDLENRYANDFHKERQEVINGDNCQVLQFDTVPQLTGQHISVLGKSVPLRVQGQLWIRLSDNRLLRIDAKQRKLPKGCRNYEFQIDYQPQVLFGKQLYLPVHTRLKIERKDKRYVVEQEYFDFEALP